MIYTISKYFGNYRILENGPPKMFRGISIFGTEQTDGSWLWTNNTMSDGNSPTDPIGAMVAMWT